MATRKRRSRGNIEERGDGFRVRVYAGVDPLTGKQHYLKETHGSYREAEKALTRLQNQVDEKRHPRSNVTVSQVLEQWLEVARHEDSTRERYQDLIRLYIEPTFGATAAAKIDAELLERFYARLRDCKDLCGGKRAKDHECTPLAANTVRKIHFIFRSAFDRAVRWRYLSVNQAEIAQPPSFERSEPDPPSAAEAASLLREASEDPQWCLLLWLTMVTGCRRGELCALRWGDVDLAAGMLSIERSYSKTRERAREKSTKTRQRRRIALDTHTVELLQEHREQARSNCAALGTGFDDNAFVFSTEPDGSAPLLPRSVSQRYRRLAQRLELRSTRLHALRHYSATELLANGTDLRTVAGRLGHVDGGVTTLNTYAGWVTEADRKAADTIADTVPRPEPASRRPRSPYEHLAAELRDAITTGTYSPGDELPTVTDLAATHGLSTGTVQRAITLLRQEGLIDVARGRRATVADQGPSVAR
ncbi:tyrosine-type recombinase/integrase [Actinopolyspora sp. H202]|uniref:tyrosine-type recombinase/integrase n=1 Tax=Actinopolyspora sp. H202 TaxID=1500456 RepID=UPI003EE51B58